MSDKIYDYKQSREVISDAWRLAIKHLEDTLGSQYSCRVSEDALPVFHDKVEQDITYLVKCPVCHNVVGEGEVMRSVFAPEYDICWNCHEEEVCK